MRYYEMLYIVHPNYEQDRLESVMDSVKKEMARLNMNILNVDVWGKRKLAYLINKQRYGSYVLVYFEADTQTIVELSQWMEIQSTVLHQIVIKLEEKPVFENDEEVVVKAAAPAAKPVVKPVAAPVEEATKVVEKAEETQVEPAKEAEGE